MKDPLIKTCLLRIQEDLDKAGLQAVLMTFDMEHHYVNVGAHLCTRQDASDSHRAYRASLAMILAVEAMTQQITDLEERARVVSLIKSVATGLLRVRLLDRVERV